MHFERKVDVYIDHLPDFERQTAERIREMIHASIPEGVEKLSFQIPFYHFYGMFCYLNVLKDGVGLEWVFCRGKDLVEAHSVLQTRGRAMVAGITIKKEMAIDWAYLQQILYDAISWQQMAFEQKKAFVKRAKKKGKP